MTTLEFWKVSSENVMELQQETTNHILGLRSEAASNVAEVRHNFSQMSEMIRQIQEIMTEGRAQRSDGSTCSSQQSDAMSVRTTDSTKAGINTEYIGSPEKKIPRSANKTRISRPRGILAEPIAPPPNQEQQEQYSNANTNQQNQEPSAQYEIPPRTPDHGDT